MNSTPSRLARDHPDFLSRHPELPLASAYEMRNVLAHGYFKIDLAIVWNTIKNELPAMRSRVLELLRTQAPH